MTKQERDKLRELASYAVSAVKYGTGLMIAEAYAALQRETYADELIALLDYIDQLEQQLSNHDKTIKDVRWRVNDVREQLVGPFYQMDEFGATSINLKQVVAILDSVLEQQLEHLKGIGGKV